MTSATLHEDHFRARSPLRVLWLGRTIPLPLDSGDRIYTAYLVESVGDHVEALTYMALGVEAEDDPRSLSAKVEWKSLSSRRNGHARFLFSSLPMASVRHRTTAFRRAVRHELREGSWDAVVLDHYSMVWCLDEIEDAGYRGIVAHVSHDFETRVVFDLAKDFKGSRIKRRILSENAKRTASAERRLATRCQVVSAITEEDCREFVQIGNAYRYLALHPGYKGGRAPPRIISKDVPRRVVMVGSFAWLAKQQNLKGFIAAADRKFLAANVRCHVIGRIPEPLARKLKATTRAFTFLGFVNDVAREFEQSRISVVAEQTGGGFKLKMLDYLFHRVPLYALENALAGLPAEIKRHTASFETMDALVDGILGGIDQDEKLNSMQHAAYDAAADLYDWADRGRRFARALDEAKSQLAQKNGAPGDRRPNPLRVAVEATRAKSRA